MPTPSLQWVGLNQKQESYLLNADETVIGRSSGVDLLLGDRGVSRRHAKIARTEKDFLIVDLDSSHGTFVNGKRIDQQKLGHGDRIRLGADGVELRFTVSSSDSTHSHNIWNGGQVAESIIQMATIVPAKGSVHSELEKISCILDFQYYWGKNFSPEGTFQQLLKSALDISGAERGYILMKKPTGFRFEVGLDSRGDVLSQADFRTSQSVVSRVAEEDKPVVMTQGILGDFAQQESIVAMNVRALACLPLKDSPADSVKPELLGILYLDSTRKMHSLSGLDQKILTKLAEQAGLVLEKLEMLKGLEERKKIEMDLALAHETQRSLLPRSLPQFDNFRIHAFSKPTRHVGGDFYDFMALPSGDWAGVLADVSGKGMPAALLSSMLQGALSSEMRSKAHPEEAMSRLNRLLCEKSLPSQFATLFFFLMDQQGTGQFISAGHNPAYLFRSKSGNVEQLTSGSMILGAFDFATFEVSPFQLESGDMLLVYSDGLTDAENPEGEMFGEDRLLKILESEGPSGSGTLEAKLLHEVETFTQGHHQTDDITFMLVHKCI